MITRLIGMIGLTACLAVVYLFEGSSHVTGAFRLLHWPAMVLTGLGPFALVFLCFDFRIIFRTVKLALGKSPASRQEKREREAIFLQKLSHSFYDQGAQVFEKLKPRGLSPFIKKVVDRLSVRMPLADIRELSELDRVRTETELVQSLNLVSFGVRLSPSIGMLGTILGMVGLLSTIEDPSHIGSQMSLALLTTFYGLFFSLALWTPLQQKLERVLDIEMEGCDQALRWLDLLERRKPTTYFADSANLPQENRRAA